MDIGESKNPIDCSHEFQHNLSKTPSNTAWTPRESLPSYKLICITTLKCYIVLYIIRYALVHCFYIYELIIKSINLKLQQIYTKVYHIICSLCTSTHVEVQQSWIFISWFSMIYYDFQSLNQKLKKKPKCDTVAKPQSKIKPLQWWLICLVWIFRRVIYPVSLMEGVVVCGTGRVIKTFS
jgi:hypothetical protein